MYRAGFEIEFITPAFIRGADPTNVEIRAPSIKGAMRWWFRALAGRYFGDNVENLSDAENEVFGSTSRASDVVIEVIPKSSPRNLHFKPCRVIDRNSKVAELKYLWFSIMLLSREKSGCQFQQYYPPGSKFEVIIKAQTEKSFKVALASIWALINLGGLGFRSRRGAGSIKIVGGDLRELERLALPSKLSSVKDIREGIENCMEIIRQYVQSRGYKEEKSPPRYPVLSSVYLSRVGYNDYLKALERFEGNYKKFRKKIFLHERIVFGLPIKIKSNKKSNKKDKTGKKKDDNAKRILKNALPKTVRNDEKINRIVDIILNGRRASPLLIGVVEINGKSYVRCSVLESSKLHPGIPDSLVKWDHIYEFLEDYLTMVWPKGGYSW